MEITISRYLATANQAGLEWKASNFSGAFLSGKNVRVSVIRRAGSGMARAVFDSDSQGVVFISEIE